MTFTLKEIADIVGGSIEGNSSKSINGIGTLDSANSNQISYAVSTKYKDSLKSSNAGAFIIKKDLKHLCPNDSIIVDNVYLAYSILTHKFKVNQNIQNLSYDQQLIYPNSYIAANSLIGLNVMIGTKSTIGANCVIEDNVKVGSNTLIESNVIIQKGCQIGDNCVISPGAVIGSEGFGNARDTNQKWSAIGHLGNVFIGDNVSIGANTTIDRAVFDSTIISKNSFIDNLVQIAHNVCIGEEAIIAAQTGIAGSTKIGNNVVIGGQAGIAGHLNIGKNVQIAAKSCVTKNIEDNSIVAGFPAVDIKRWKISNIKLNKL